MARKDWPASVVARGMSSVELSSPAAAVGETRRSLILSNQRGAGSSPRRVFDNGKLRSRAHGDREFVSSIGDGLEEFQGMELVEYGSNGCGATSANSTWGRRSRERCRVAAWRSGVKAMVW
jgi:hypothetical protein